jgi:hypothetical protein
MIIGEKNTDVKRLIRATKTFWKITICWRLMNLMKQFSIMGPIDCKQNNIQLQYRHTQENRILEFHSLGNEMF